MANPHLGHPSMSASSFEMDRDRVDPDLISPDEARARAVALAAPLPPARVPLEDAGWLVLADPVVAPFDLPRFDNSAMDGFAVRSADTGAPARLRVVGGAFAGRPAAESVGAGEAVAIATGALVPEGSDAVALLEDVEVLGDEIAVRVPVAAGANVRLRGEDVAAGRTLVAAGTVLGPGQVAALAAAGLDSVMVHPRPRVAIVPTGDEVRPPGSDLGAGQVHDAVSSALVLLLREIGAVACPRPPAPDEPEGLLAALREAGEVADAVITVGGASAGQRDLVHGLAGRGALKAVRVAMRPAKPFVLGRLFGVPLFGLPGNPAAALAGFEELVRPAILAMMGRQPLPRHSVAATLTEPLRQRPGRLHLVRVLVWRDGERLLARPAGSQGAGMMHSLAGSNAWAVVPPDMEDMGVGSEIQVRLLTDPR
jgi:molybdopterin molybdotransferase